jgi:hypothetical protein
MPQMDASTFFSVFETLMISFIFQHIFINTHLLLPFINTMKVHIALKGRLFFINHLIMKRVKSLNSYKHLKSIKIKF